MLTASGTYSLDPGTKKQHTSSATLTVYALFDKASDTYTMRVDAIYSGIVEGGVVFTCAKSRLTGFTSSGADDILKAFNLCEQVVKNELESYAENSGITFTIS